MARIDRGQVATLSGQRRGENGFGSPTIAQAPAAPA